MPLLRDRGRALIVALVAVLGVASSLATAPSRAASVSCTAYASPAGSDSTGDGSISAPFASLTKLDAALAPGQTGCLEAGNYGSTSTQMDLDTNGTPTGQIVLTAVPGATPHVTGFIEMNGTNTTLSNLSIDGSNTFYSYAGSFNPCSLSGAGSQGLQINGQGDVFENNDYYQSVASLRGNGIGVGFNGNGSPGANGNNVVVRYNKIHDVGICQAYDHAIYLDAGNGAQIYGNWMYNDAHGFGVQVYPGPSNAHIFSNVIYNIGSGFTLGGAATVSGNVIDDNVVANSTGLPNAGTSGQCIQSYWPGTPGTGNQAYSNDCFADPAGVGSGTGVNVYGNITTDPQFVNAAADDFQVASTSPAASWGLPTLAQVGPASSSGGGSGKAGPGMPTGMTATGNNGSVTLTWTANPASDGVTGYNVYRVGQTFTGPWATTSATTFTNASQVTNGTQYCYQISAVNSVGASALTAPVCATPRAAPAVPATPTGLTATGNNGSVTLHWNANPASDRVTRYNVYRIGQAFTPPWATTSATSFTNVSQVTNGTQYCYQISATNATGTSPKTARACATPH